MNFKGTFFQKRRKHTPLKIFRFRQKSIRGKRKKFPKKMDYENFGESDSPSKGKIVRRLVEDLLRDEDYESSLGELKATLKQMGFEGELPPNTPFVAHVVAALAQTREAIRVLIGASNPMLLGILLESTQQNLAKILSDTLSNSKKMGDLETFYQKNIPHDDD